MTDDIRFMYDNITFNIMTPAGEATIILVEDRPGVLYKVFFTIGKAGSEVNANCYAIAELVSFALQKGASIDEMIKLLEDITSDRPILDLTGSPCRSVPEALFLVLSRYNRFASKLQEPVTLKEFRPPKFNHTR